MADDITLYKAIGGHQAVVDLVDHFYDAMDTLPVAAGIRALHADDLTSDRHKLAAFLSGWLGGPPLYWHEYGHPRLRARHRHLPIDSQAAAAWMACMTKALDEVVDDPSLRTFLQERFATVADHMRNQPDETPPG